MFTACSGGKWDNPIFAGVRRWRSIAKQAKELGMTCLSVEWK